MTIATEEHIITMAEALNEMRRDIRFGDRFCLVQVAPGHMQAGSYYLGPSRGCTPNRGEAHAYTVREAAQTGAAMDHLVHLLPLAPLSDHVELLLTIGEALERREELEGRMCFVVEAIPPVWTEGCDFQYYASGYYTDLGYAGTRDGAMLFNDTTAAINEIGKWTTMDSQRVRIVVLPRNAVPPSGPPPQHAPPPEPPKGCKIEECLTPAIIELLRAAPLNEVVRTQVHAAILVALPAEAKTYDEIKAWIEANIVPRHLRRISPTPPGPEGLRIRVRVTEDQRGNCLWRGRMAGGSMYNVPFNELHDMVTNAIEEDSDWDTLCGKVEDWLDEAAADSPPDMEEDGERTYYEHETTDSDSVSRQAQGVSPALASWVRRNMLDAIEHIDGAEDVPF